MKIGMADAAGLHGNQDFTGTGFGPRDFCDHERLLEFLEDGSFHGVTANSAKVKRVFMNRAI
jgi:hypothetical protein